MADSSDNENETSAQELMALVVPKGDDDDDDDDDESDEDEEDVGNESSAFMNDTASSIGDAVAAVLADAAVDDVPGDTDAQEEGPSDLNLEGPEPTQISSMPAVGGVSGMLDQVNMSSQLQPLYPQQLPPGMAPIPSIVPPYLLQQAGNAAVFAAAMNPYLFAAAASGFPLAAPNVFMMQPQQQQITCGTALPIPFPNPNVILGSAGNNSSLLESLGLNPALLPQQQQQLGSTASTASPSPAPENPETNDNNYTFNPPTNNTGAFPMPMQPPQLDPAAFLRAALLMQNSAMMMPGILPQQVMTQDTPASPGATQSGLNETDASNASTTSSSVSNNVVVPNPPASLFPVAFLQQLVPIIGATAMGAVPFQNVQLQQQVHAPQQQQQQPEPQHQGSQTNFVPNPVPSAQRGSQRAIPLYLDHDESCLTAYQCFLRKQIELFEAGDDELQGTAQGRNTPLHRGQIGIRCRHCAHLPKAARSRGGVYYSRTIDGVCKYAVRVGNGLVENLASLSHFHFCCGLMHTDQVAQNMSKLHFLKSCNYIPESTKNQLKSLQHLSSRASGGKEYWSEGLRVLGVVEDKRGFLKFQVRKG
jgi:hypothetical protein